MEKASTPRNRLTRSSAKQVNTPKNVEQEESIERDPGEEVKHNVRKTRRRYDNKAKTNGDTANLENIINNEDTIEDNMDDKSEQDDLCINSLSQDSPKTTPKKTPSPTISRRSLRTRRSSTPGPEIESSTCKKMKRSSSFGKLDSVSTSINRKGRRANSESKDFVFTPSKDKQSSSHDLNIKHIPNAPLRIIEKIDEVNEGEKSSEDEKETLNQGEKALSNVESEGKASEKDNIAEKYEIKAINETSVKETDLSTHSEQEVNANVILNDSSSQNVCNGVEPFDISENDPQLSNKEKAKENKTEGISPNTKENEAVEINVNTKENETEEINPNTKVNETEEINANTKENETEEINANQKENETKEINDNTKENESEEINANTKENETEEINVNTKENETKEINVNTKENETEEINANTKENRTQEINDNTKENETEEINANTKVEDVESTQESCLLSVEIETKPPNLTMSSERNKSQEIGSPAKEILQQKKLQSEGNVTELVSISEEKTSQLSAVDNDISENPDCDIHKSVEMIDITHNKTKKTNEFEVKNIEIELDDDNEPEISFKQLGEQLQNIIDEGLEESDDEHTTVSSKSDCQQNSKIQNETESNEISKIDLIDSSDSEGGIIEGQHKISIVKKCENDSFHTEHENIIIPGIDKNKCSNEYLTETTETKTENLSGLVPQKYPQMIDPEMGRDHNDQKLDKVTQEDCKRDDMENETYISNKTETISDQSRIDVIEGDLSSKREEIPNLCFMDTEPSDSFNLVIENPHTIGTEGLVPENSTSNAEDNNFQDPLLQDQCPDLDGVHKHNEFQEKEVDGGSSLRLNDQVTNQSDVSLDKCYKPESEENYDEESYNEENINENYEDEELNKSEEGSCDIYKGLSDSSCVDEKAEDAEWDSEIPSSEVHSGSGNSEEEDITSVDDDNDEEENLEANVEDKTGPLNELGSGSIKLKGNELMLSKDGKMANEKNPDSPMTYDKALAIINKNRVKKIDDEEFFDMFTEELNRVSEASGSDSDIAIVDEYLVEPEEPAKKNQPKSGNAQNAKQPTTGTVLTNQLIPPENYPGDFSQPVNAHHGHPIPTQHSHPAMPRVNFTQGNLYQQFDPNMHLRGQLMYNQYAHPSTSMQDPHMFNSPIAHPDVNCRGGMFNHTLPPFPVSESSFPPNSSPLKVRSVTDMNAQSLAYNKNHSNSDQAPMDEGIFERQEGKDSYLNMSSTSVAEINNIDTGGSIRPNNSDRAIRHEFSDKVVKSRTPILDLLGLHKKSLKLLKKDFGLNSIKREIMKRDLEWQKKCLEKSILKSELRQRGRKRESRYRNVKGFRESDSSSLKSSSEQSSEDSSSSGFSKGRHYGSSSENDNREVNIEDGSVYITLQTKSKSKHRNKKEHFRLKKAFHSDQESLDTVKLKNRTKFRRKPRSSAVENSKKMPQKQPTVVKSQCGTFTVDPLTASSQSSDSEVQYSDDKNQDEELEMKMKMKRDLASGKNKLSNMFSHSLKKSKESRGKVSEPFQEIKGPLRKQNLKELRKLPSEILETLAKEDKKKKRRRSEESGSDDILERPKKIRKNRQKMKVKSKAGDQNYIPCVTGGATEFGLSRLDQDGTVTLAEKAAKFRTDQLYGASVKRITSKELMNMKKKQNMNDSLAKKRMSRKRNFE